MNERDQYIQAAANLVPEFRDDIGGPGRYEGCDDPELTAALEIIVNDGWADDEISIPAFGYVSRVGPYVYQCDALGFRDSYPITEAEWETFVASEVDGTPRHEPAVYTKR